MEGKAALFKRFAGIDALPICLDTQDVDEIVATVKAIAPVFAGINLEDISAPRCFEIERRLREQLDIPVFHDDQHGTAIVVLAALTNALRVVEQGHRRRPDRACPAPARPAPRSSSCCWRRAPATSWSPTSTASCTPSARTIWPSRAALDRRATPTRAASREPARGAAPAPTCSSASRRRTSSPATTSRRWPTARSCSPSPTPTPEVDRPRPPSTPPWSPPAAATSPNQINNVLAFPGVFRGLLDARVATITVDDAARGRRARSPPS